MNKEEVLLDSEYQDLVAKIDKYVDYIDVQSHAHNIIGLALQQVAEDFGNEYANDLIEEFQLEDKGWHKVVDDRDHID